MAHTRVHLRPSVPVDIYREGAFPPRMPTISEAGSATEGSHTSSRHSEHRRKSKHGNGSATTKSKGKGKQRATTPSTPTPGPTRQAERLYNFPEPSTASGSSFTDYGVPVPHPALEPLDRGTYAGGQRRSMDDIREQVARTLAVKMVNAGEEVNNHLVGICVTLHKAKDLHFLRRVASCIDQILSSNRDDATEYLFIVCTSAQSQPTPPHRAPAVFPLADDADPNSRSDPVPYPPIERVSGAIIAGSSPAVVQKAGIILMAKFVGRSELLFTDGGRLWLGRLFQLGETMHDEDALWDVVRKSAQYLHGYAGTSGPNGGPGNPLIPPPGSRGIDEILSQARSRIERIPPAQAFSELTDSNFPFPIVLVDIRPEAQRRVEGEIAGAIVIERNVLEWRLDPRSDARLPIADRYDIRVIVVCQEGYTSSLAAASLQDLGLLQATDIIGGVRGWREVGLPVQRMRDDWDADDMDAEEGYEEEGAEVYDPLAVNDSSSLSEVVSEPRMELTPSEYERRMEELHRRAGYEVDDPPRSVASEDGEGYMY